MDLSRPFKKVWGVAYTNVIPGDNPTKRVTAHMGDRQQLYNDPAVRLSQADLERFKSLKGKPICREHDPNVVLGYIHGYDVGRDGHLRVMARIYTDSDEGIQACEDLERGNLNGFSVGYSASMDRGSSTVSSKTFHELTLTKEPFFEGCRVSVQASLEEKKNLPSKEGAYKSIPIWIQLSFENNMSTPETTEQKATAPQENLEKDASSLLHMADKLQEEVDQAKAAATKERTEKQSEIEKMRQEMEQIRREKAELEAFKKARQDEYAEAKAAEAQEVVSIHEEMRGQKFPEEARQHMIKTMCSLDAEDQKVASIMCSQAQTFKNEREARLKAEDELKQLREAAAARAEEDKLTQARITASRGSMQEIYKSDSATTASATPEEDDDDDAEMNIQASSAGADENWPYRGYTGDFVMVPKPSHADTQLGLLRSVARVENSMHIKASKAADGNKTLQARTAPRHKMLHAVPFSMRNRTPWYFGAWVHMGDQMTEGIDVQLSALPGDGERKLPEMGVKEIKNL